MRWFGHIERKNCEEFVKKVYVICSEIVGHRRRPVIRWKDRGKEYMHERFADRGGGIELERRECLDKERWRLFCHRGQPLRDVSRGIRNYR